MERNRNLVKDTSHQPPRSIKISSRDGGGGVELGISNWIFIARATTKRRGGLRRRRDFAAQVAIKCHRRALVIVPLRKELT